MRVNVLCQPLPYIAACLTIGSIGGFLAALIGVLRDRRGGDCGNGCPCG